MVEVTMEALTMASRLWTGIEKVTIISSFCDPIFDMVSRSGIKISLFFKGPMCANESPVQTLLAPTSLLPKL